MLKKRQASTKAKIRRLKEVREAPECSSSPVVVEVEEEGEGFSADELWLSPTEIVAVWL